MLSIDVSQVINGLVEQLLHDRNKTIKYEGKQRTSPGLRFVVETRISSYAEQEHYEAKGKIVFIISGNTSVWYALPAWDSREEIPLSEFINSSNHDSCWRDGVQTPLTKLYFELCEQVNEQRWKDHLKKVAPVAMNVYTTFSWLGSPVFECVSVTDVHAEDYRRALVSVKKE